MELFDLQMLFQDNYTGITDFYGEDQAKAEQNAKLAAGFFAGDHPAAVAIRSYYSDFPSDVEGVCPSSFVQRAYEWKAQDERLSTEGDAW